MLRSVAVVLTGASGIIYGVRLLEALRDYVKGKIYAVFTRAAEVVAKHELGVELCSLLERKADEVYSEEAIDAPLASSSNVPDAVIVAPCTVSMLAKVANGVADTLAPRLVLNALRMRRKVILVLRETPLSTIDLLNALKASITGAVILPASPGFYHKPKTVDDMVDFVVGKVLEVLGLEHNLYPRWNPSTTSPRQPRNHVSS